MSRELEAASVYQGPGNRRRCFVGKGGNGYIQLRMVVPSWLAEVELDWRECDSDVAGSLFIYLMF